MAPSIPQEVVARILRIMQQSLVKIVLYGSAARGTDTEESDVDIALLMVEPLDRDTEDLLFFLKKMDCLRIMRTHQLLALCLLTRHIEATGCPNS
ncbi:MAG: nucleotidyltransferase domain-containing protein [Firmicutes bacterium]|nr:nucleotidyltransferase domain-containing protein [Bacillota bacterium]